MTKKSLATLSKAVKAPQAIVHIKHSITLNQYKLWVLLLRKWRELYELKELPDEKGFYKISKEEIKSHIGYELSKFEFRRDLGKLRQEPITVNYFEKDDGEVLHDMGFISESKTYTKAIRFRLPSFLEDVMKGLDQPKAIFQLINWEIFNHFTGKYEAIIYKLCRDYVGVVNTPYMTIEEFREYVGLKPNEYKGFMDLHRYIIKNPVNKINESNLSDITVSYSLRREGKKVVGLYFSAKNKHQTSIPFQEFKQNPAFQFAKIHIETSLQSEYLALRSSEEVALCIERVNEYAEEQSKLRKSVNYGALYRTAILEGWHTGYAEQKAKKSALEDKKREVEQNELNQEEKRQLEEKNRLLQKKKIDDKLAYFDQLPEKQKDDLRESFKSNLSGVHQQMFIKHGEKSGINRHHFVLFLEEQGILSKDQK